MSSFTVIVQQSMVGSDVMSLIPIHFPRHRESPLFSSAVLFSSVLFHDNVFSSLSFGRSLSSGAFLPASSVQHVSALFIQTIGRSRQNKQTQSNSFHKINRRSNWFRQTHINSSQATKVIQNRPQSQSEFFKAIPHWGTIQLCCKNMSRNFALTDLSYFRPTDQ